MMQNPQENDVKVLFQGNFIKKELFLDFLVDLLMRSENCLKRSFIIEMSNDFEYFQNCNKMTKNMKQYFMIDYLKKLKNDEKVLNLLVKKTDNHFKVVIQREKDVDDKRLTETIVHYMLNIYTPQNRMKFMKEVKMFLQENLQSMKKNIIIYNGKYKILDTHIIDVFIDTGDF